MPDYRELDWLDHAACRNEDPASFDETDPRIAFLTILTFCVACPVAKLCLDRVRPASSNFDGIAGGILWKEGREVDLRDLLS